jgi:hypothetical protein
VFHLQSEDSGPKHRRIVTHLFVDGGRIIKTERTEYSEHVGKANFSEVLRSLMKEQHKRVFKALRAGELDALVESICGPFPQLESTPTSAAPKSEPSSPRPPLAEVKKLGESAAPPRRKQVLSDAPRPSLFGDDLPETSLDEVILSYLAETDEKE